MALGHAGVQFGQFDAAQGLTGLHAAAFGDRQRQQRARGLGAHQGGLRRHQRPRKLHQARQARQLRLNHLAREEFQRDIGLLVDLGHGVDPGHPVRPGHQGQPARSKDREHRTADPPLPLHAMSPQAGLATPCASPTGQCKERSRSADCGCDEAGEDADEMQAPGDGPLRPGPAADLSRGPAAEMPDRQARIPARGLPAAG